MAERTQAVLGAAVSLGTRFAYKRRMALDSTLILTALVKRYGDTRAVDGIDLTLQRGEVLALVGES
ncbi:MAG TPA: hypothetical protein VFA35_05175, partial [Burkholderiaceae bacterium]|nr:hypothetical protein [Burkholderiaceae bacterium]